MTDGETLEEMREQTGGAGGDGAEREGPIPLEIQGWNHRYGSFGPPPPTVPKLG